MVFRNNYDSLLLKYLKKIDVEKLLIDSHNGLVGRHFSKDGTMHKVLTSQYYWLKLFKYAHAHVYKCHIFHTFVAKQKQLAMDLRHVTIDRFF